MRESTGRGGAWLAIGAALALVPSRAGAVGERPSEVVGLVVSAESRWASDGGAIVTETTMATASGERVLVYQLGGVVGDVAMIVSHAPPLLAVGSWARVETGVGMAETGRAWRVLTKVIEADGLGPSAIPFVRTTTASGTPLFWESGCAAIGVRGEALTLPGNLEIDAIGDAVEEWRGALADCSYLDLRFVGAISAEPRFDGVNVIRFREDRWCRPANGDDPEVCHERSAAALTFLTFGVAGERNGAILDADIELNGVDFALTVDGQSTGSAPCGADLANTLTHELGHFLGLDHTCWDGRGARPVDHTGAPVPSCSPEAQLSAAVRDATMYNFQECGETKKQSLEPDDAASVCAIYASSAAPGECVYPDAGRGSFCAVGTRSDPIALVWVLITLALTRRRRSP